MFTDIRFIMILFILIIILVAIYIRLKETKIKQKHFHNYLEFLESIKNKEPIYYNQMITIIHLINEKKMRDLKKIAKLSGCEYYETILKIKVLKSQKAIENYYIDIQNGILNPCSEKDKQLIEKYDQFIYGKQLQPEEIAKSFPRTTLMNLDLSINLVLEELAYLDEKGLLNGINIDLVDRKIIYYDIESSKKGKDYVSITCDSCGAPNDVPRKGKARCKYCNRILEEQVKK